MANKNLIQGKFTPKNPSKYKGNPTNIIYRSSWELKCMRKFDEDTTVLEWSSEELYIHYLSPKDNRIHRYFPDFIIKKVLKTGEIKTFMLEVKPLSQVKPPVKQKKSDKYLLKEVITWGINQAKFQAASDYCKDKKWEFAILTEKQIGTF